ADVEETATGATALQTRETVAQAEQRVVRASSPEFAEGALLHVAERDTLPELVGMHVALRVDVANAHTGTVRAAAVPFEQCFHFLHALRGFALKAQQPVGA